MSWSLDSVHIQRHLWPPTTVANMSSIRPWSLSNYKTDWLQLNGLTHQTPTGRSEHWLMEETWEYVTVEWLWGKFQLLPNCIISCCVAICSCWLCRELCQWQSYWILWVRISCKLSTAQPIVVQKNYPVRCDDRIQEDLQRHIRLWYHWGL